MKYRSGLTKATCEGLSWGLLNLLGWPKLLHSWPPHWSTAQLRHSLEDQPLCPRYGLLCWGGDSCSAFPAQLQRKWWFGPAFQRVAALCPDQPRENEKLSSWPESLPTERGFSHPLMMSSTKKALSPRNGDECWKNLGRKLLPAP